MQGRIFIHESGHTLSKSKCHLLWWRAFLVTGPPVLAPCINDLVVSIASRMSLLLDVLVGMMIGEEIPYPKVLIVRRLPPSDLPRRRRMKEKRPSLNFIYRVFEAQLAQK
jgi:hypothetical protein